MCEVHSYFPASFRERFDQFVNETIQFAEILVHADRSQVLSWNSFTRNIITYSQDEECNGSVTAEIDAKQQYI